MIYMWHLWPCEEILFLVTYDIYSQVYCPLVLFGNTSYVCPLINVIKQNWLSFQKCSWNMASNFCLYILIALYLILLCPYFFWYTLILFVNDYTVEFTCLLFLELCFNSKLPLWRLWRYIHMLSNMYCLCYNKNYKGLLFPLVAGLLQKVGKES
jgi:hypothetical protein